jgi:ribosomal protein S18 acetylase RimI-like enzyme
MVWAVRRASRADLPGLRDLCKAAVGPDDYVLHYLEWEIENYFMHVALDDARAIVGMATYRPCIDGSGWLAMARTHPDHRRQGVNRAIVDSFVRLARRRGARFLRLWTNAGNAEGVATFRRIGFREVGRFTRLLAPPEPGAVKSEVVRSADRLWRRVRNSALVRDGGGLIAHGWEFVRADRPTIRRIAASGAVRSWGRNVLATPELPRPAGEEPILQLTPLAGRSGDLLAEGRRIAAAEGRPGVGAYVPHTREQLRTAKHAGFEVVEWGDEAILCELPVPPVRSHRRRPGSGTR